MTALEWTVPVITADDRRQVLRVEIIGDEVVLVTPRGEQLAVPVASDDQLCEAIRAARGVARQMGQGLS